MKLIEPNYLSSYNFLQTAFQMNLLGEAQNEGSE